MRRAFLTSVVFCLSAAMVTATQAIPVVSGLKAHYAADTIVGLSDGDAVTSWLDLSGFGHHLSVAGSAPAYVGSGINNLPNVRFNGLGGLTSDFSGSSDLAYTEATVFMVTSESPATRGTFISISQAGTDVGQEIVFFKFETPTPAGGFHHTSNGVFTFQLADAEPTAPYLTTGVFGASITDIAMYFDGVPSTQPILFSGSGGADFVSVPRYVSVGVRAPTLREPHIFDAAEILIYEGKMSDGDRRAVEDFLLRKYDLGDLEVPEPTTILLLGIGVAGLWFWRHHPHLNSP